jgi:hypothetical protein
MISVKSVNAEKSDEHQRTAKASPYDEMLGSY